MAQFIIIPTGKDSAFADGLFHVRTHLRTHKSLLPLSPAFCRVLSTLVMRATLHTDARLTEETSRSESGDPVCRPIGFCYPAIRLTCAADLKEQCSGCSRQRGNPHLGLIPCTQASRFRATFQVLFCRGPMLQAHALLAATSARGTPLRSGQGGDTASPAAAKSDVTASACAMPNSTISAPSGASKAGAAAAMPR
jgi:hypothetical protein